MPNESVSPPVFERLYLLARSGPYNDFGWDWTAWTGINIE